MIWRMDTKVEAGEPKITRQMTLADFDRMFPDETSCKAYLMAQRWPNGVRCPRCGNDKVYAGKAKPWTWECKKCGAGKSAYRFSVIAGTIFENTNYKLLIWFKVLYLMLTSKKGISALQIHRMIGSGSYRTAWFMCHRLRAGLAEPEFRQLMGIVEVDETFLGGKQGNRHANVRAKYHGRGAANTGKITVVGAIARKGNVVCQIIENADVKTLSRFVKETVSNDVSLVATDEWGGYRWVKPMKYPHQTVDHKAGEYVRGEVHTNNIENFWSLLKRGVIGTYHNVSKKYLPLYLNEFAFRHNNRKNADIFGSAVAGC
jgi:transposase-like protein